MNDAEFACWVLRGTVSYWTSGYKSQGRDLLWSLKLAEGLHWERDWSGQLWTRFTSGVVSFIRRAKSTSCLEGSTSCYWAIQRLQNLNLLQALLSHNIMIPQRAKWRLLKAAAAATQRLKLSRKAEAEASSTELAVVVLVVSVLPCSVGGLLSHYSQLLALASQQRRTHPTIRSRLLLSQWGYLRIATLVLRLRVRRTRAC